MRSSRPEGGSRRNYDPKFANDHFEPSRPSKLYTVSITNIPPLELFDQQDAFDIFREFGIVRGVYLKRDECLVSYATRDEANLAVHKGQGILFKGYKLVVHHFSEYGNGKPSRTGHPDTDILNNHQAVSHSNSSCVVLYHRRCPRYYADYVSSLIEKEAKVKNCRMRGIPQGEHIDHFVSKVAQECCTSIVVLLTPENVEFNSVTVIIVGPCSEEHRNMPLRGAVELIRSRIVLDSSSQNKHSERRLRSPNFDHSDKRKRSNSPKSTRLEREDDSRKVHRSAFSAMFQLLADGKTLRRIEDYDDLIDYLKAKREQLVGPRRAVKQEYNDDQSMPAMDLQELSRNFYNQTRMPIQTDQSIIEGKPLSAENAVTPAAAIAAAAAYFAAATAAASQQSGGPPMFGQQANNLFNPAGAWAAGWTSNMPK